MNWSVFIFKWKLKGAVKMFNVFFIKFRRKEKKKNEEKKKHT